MPSSAFKIQLNQLSPAFIQEMKEKYGEAELEIKVNRKPDFIPLKEAEFWAIIDLLDWDKETDDAILAPAIQQLKNSPIAHIYAFEDKLSEKLYQLDQQKMAENIGENAYQKDKYFSVDLFLYARACVVANGKAAFEEVLENPLSMPKGITFEPLLSLAARTYELKTGRVFNYNPSPNYETYSNQQGWKAFFAPLLISAKIINYGVNTHY